MARKRESKTIDGIEVTCVQHGVFDGLALGTKLGKLLGPALAKAQGLSVADDVSKLAPALSELFSRLDGAEAQSLLAELLSGSVALYAGPNGPVSMALGKRDAIELVFAGNLPAAIKAAVFAAQVNFSNFFGAALAAASTSATPAANA